MLELSLGSGRHLVLPLLLAYSTTAAPTVPQNANQSLAAIRHSTNPGVVTHLSSDPVPLSALNTQRYVCPISCSQSGFDPTNWSAYHGVSRLAYCNQTMLLDFTIHNGLTDPNSHVTIRSCAAGPEVAPSYGVEATKEATRSRIAKRGTAGNSCSTNAKVTQIEPTLQLAFNGSGSSASISDLSKASQQMMTYLAQQGSNCEQAIAFAYSGSAVIGMFAGEGVRGQGVAETVLQQFTDSISSKGYSDSVLVQLCSGDGRSSRYSMGIFASSNADLASVQDAVALWASAGCVKKYDTAQSFKSVTLSIPTSDQDAPLVKGSSTTEATTATQAVHINSPRTTCTAEEVKSGDTCSSLASECGITPAQFTQYNPNPNLCSTLQAGEHVCCSAGTLPDYSPNPYANGTCATYLVQSGDYCQEIAASYSLNITQLENFNNKTWGWMGCTDLQAGQTICLSTGYPPMPAVVQNAECGPQVPGTPIAPGGTNYSTLNECPLNACCDIWGQCGTTTEFCTESQSPTGAPGTAAVGANGCISNCGTQIVTGSAPSSDFVIGYFEAFNLARPCLDQPIADVDLSGYTHVHLAFATITPDFALNVSSIQSQFDSFVTMTGFQRILSIGGWAFCTDPGTYALFREAVAPGNQDTFASNIASFISEYQLDGIDIDWEYPGEPDIPGIPPGTAADGPNYVSFLQSLSNKMPEGTTISFTAPSSFWYLKAFEIAKMAPLVDYVIFMTYDLHGQWDYGNPWSDPGCPGGNCLRSDVNLTETMTSLSMITKAGVPANQIVVGVTSYGRSFQMTTADCYTSECTYTGPSSGAYAGLCTQTAGYISNAEINTIIAGTGQVTDGEGNLIGISGTPLTYLDNSSYSNIVVYDETQWIGYMDDANKAQRASIYKGYNFLGTADWAIDLQSLAGDDGNSNTSSTIVTVPPSIWTSGNPGITCEPPCIFVLPPYPLGITETITWPALTTTLLSSSGNNINTITTTINVPEFTITALSLQPITMAPTDTETYEVNPVQSVTPTSFILTLGPNEATFPPSAIPTNGSSQGGPAPSGGNPNPGTTTTTTSGAIIPPGVTFYTTPFPITIQPQPTISITIPPLETPIPPISISTGTPEPPCSGSGCGSRNCGIFGCSPGCGLFGCDGGCSIFGCGGGCGPLGCAGSCPLDVCGGVGCDVPGSCGGDGSDPDGDDCDSPVTVSACTYLVNSYMTGAMTTYSTTTTTDCSTTTTCDGDDTKTTITSGVCQASVTSEYASAIATGGTVVNGEYIPYAFYQTYNPAGASGSATDAIYGFTISSTTSNCDACTYLDTTEVICTGVDGCTQHATITTTATIHSTTTETVTAQPSVTADCAYWYLYWGYTFEIYNIVGIEESSLRKQEDGCGALTFWEWTDATASSDAQVYFDLPLTLKDGCVERALVSAGGPKLSCHIGSYTDGLKKESFRNHTEKHDKQAAVSIASQQASYISQSKIPDYSYSSLESTPSYVPMTWPSGEGSTFTFTWTYDAYSTNVITTTRVVSTATTILPGKISASHTPSSPTPTSPTTTTSVTAPGPTQSGITKNCDKYYVVSSGDSCSSIEQKFNITFAQFYAWNPAIGSGCTSLWVNEAYCVGVSSPTQSSVSATTVTPPAPTQSGCASNCTKYYVVQSGGSCSAIEQQFDITFQQFYGWNPAIGSGCTALWVGEAYCVAV